MCWRLLKPLVMACSCECGVLMLQDSLCLKRNVCWTQLCKQPLLMLHAGFATDTQQLLQRGLMSGSEYTFKLVQVCLPEPSKLVVMCDKRKRQWVCFWIKCTSPVRLFKTARTLPTMFHHATIGHSYSKHVTSWLRVWKNQGGLTGGCCWVVRTDNTHRIHIQTEVLTCS